MSMSTLLCVIFIPFAMMVPLDWSGFEFDPDPNENSTRIVAVNGTNGTDRDLYVIKTIVYEVALLTEAADDDNSTGNDTYTQEKVDLTFYNAHGNGTHVDLGDIPFPVQANVSGRIVTGIVPVHAGTLPQDKDLLSSLLPEGASISITRRNGTEDDATSFGREEEELLERLQGLRNTTEDTS